jgi:hypothetical protein
MIAEQKPLDTEVELVRRAEELNIPIELLKQAFNLGIDLQMIEQAIFEGISLEDIQAALGPGVIRLTVPARIHVKLMSDPDVKFNLYRRGKKINRILQYWLTGELFSNFTSAQRLSKQKVESKNAIQAKNKFLKQKLDTINLEEEEEAELRLEIATNNTMIGMIDVVSELKSTLVKRKQKVEA